MKKTPTGQFVAEFDVSQAIAAVERHRGEQPNDASLFEGASVIQRDSPVPYYYQLSSFVEARIKAKEWQPGQLLPSEQDLCSRLGVSRTVVRQAMAELEYSGLVSKQNGKRSYVAFPKYEGGLMQNLRGFFEEAVSKGQRLDTRVLRLEVTPASAEVAQALQLTPGEPLILLDRLRFLDGEPEVVVQTYLPLRMCPSAVEEDFSGQSLYHFLERKYGLRITQGLRTIEAILLDSKDARLLNVRPGSPALLLKSVGMLEDGTPLEYFIAKHRGDRAKFDVRLVR